MGSSLAVCAVLLVPLLPGLGTCPLESGFHQRRLCSIENKRSFSDSEPFDAGTVSSCVFVER